MDIWKDHSQEAKKLRWQALWNMEDLPRPLWFIPACPSLAVTEERMRQRQPINTFMTDKQEQLRESLKFNRSFGLMQRFWSRDDFVLRLQPQMGLGVFATAFGAPVEFPPHDMPWTHYLVKAGEPVEQILALTAPDVRAGLLGNILDYAAYFRQKAGSRYPIAMTDPQGPSDTASLVWDTSDFLAAMYTDPEAVHHLMRLITDLFIAFVKALRAQVGEFSWAGFPPVYLPEGMGVAVCDDNMVMMRPATWEKFCLPYFNAISEEFGGLVIHSCGNTEHQLDSLAKVHNLRGFNFGVSETRFEAVWAKLGGKTALIPHCSSEVVVAKFRNALEWVEHVLRIKTHNRGLALMVAPDVGDMQKTKENMVMGKKESYYSNLPELVMLPHRIRALIRKYN